MGRAQRHGRAATLSLLTLVSFAAPGCAPDASTVAGDDLLAPRDAGPLRDGGAAQDAPLLADGAMPTDGTAQTVSGTFLFTLDAGAFAPSRSHPSALVYLPSGFDPTPPLDVVVYLHGWDNCVQNVIRDTGASCDSDAGTPARSAYALAAQLEASHKNAMLLCPEAEFDRMSSNPGSLGAQGGFQALLAEVLADLAPQIGHVTVGDVRRLVVSSHSGGYEAAAGVAVRGGIPVDELYLFDSLYGNEADFDSWVKSDLPSLAGSSPARRFADVYTCCGGTEVNSQAMANRAAGWVPADAGILIDDRMTDTWQPADYHHGLLFKLSALPHDGVPRYYFEQLLATSGLADKR